jgi:hypothetical protein
MMSLQALNGPAELDCNEGCMGLTVNCQGPWPCTVVCNGNCNNLTLSCDPVGPCALHCGNFSCMGAVVKCGNNTCDVTCAQMPPQAVQCGDSCQCTDPKSPTDCHM